MRPNNSRATDRHNEQDFVRIAEGSVGQCGPTAIDARIEYKDWVGLCETRRGEQRCDCNDCAETEVSHRQHPR
jgi:hypothetical protein